MLLASASANLDSAAGQTFRLSCEFGRQQAMLSFIRRLVGEHDAMLDAGKRYSGAGLVGVIAETDVFVLAALQSDGLDAATIAQEELLAEVERAARDLNMREVGFEAFVYDRNGVICLPFFSSQRHVETFCGEYSRQLNRVFPFQVLGVKGYVLASCSAAVDVVVLNDRSSDERPLSAEEKRLLSGMAR